MKTFENEKNIWLQGKEIMEFFLAKLIESGVTHIPPWQDPNSDKREINSPTDSAIELTKLASVWTCFLAFLFDLFQNNKITVNGRDAQIKLWL